MITLIIVLLWLASMFFEARADEWESSEYNAEMRHQELMSEVRGIRSDIQKKEKEKKPEKISAARRRAIKDSSGRVLVEEVIVENLDGISV